MLPTSAFPPAVHGSRRTPQSLTLYALGHFPMRLPVIFCLLLCGCAETAVKRSTVNYGTSSDESFSRRGKRVLLTMRTKREAGHVSVSHAYSVAGDMLVIESDEDGDSLFETVILEHPNGRDIEVFRRSADGRVRPVGERELRLHKEQRAAIADFWSDAFKRPHTSKSLKASMAATRGKIIRAEAKKTNASQ